MRRQSFATLLVGPSALLREGLTRILSAADFRIIASAPCIDELVLPSAAQQKPMLLLIDAGDDLKLAARQLESFKRRHPSDRIAVLGDRDNPRHIISIFRAGANAYFIKVAPCDTFIKCLELVMLGETILPATVLAAISDDADDEEDDDWPNDGKPAEKLLEPEGGNTPQLSARERCILQCLIEGDSNKIIARKINIAEATVKVHVKAILRKIRVHNRTQAAIWAMSNAFSISAMGNSLPAPDTARVQQPLVRVLPPIRRNGSAF